METVLHLKARVLTGGRIEIVDSGLPLGESVDVMVRHHSGLPRRFAVEILEEAPGNRLFKTSTDVERVASRFLLP